MNTKPIVVVEVVGENNTPLPDTIIPCPDIEYARAIILQKAAAGKHYIILTDQKDQQS